MQGTQLESKVDTWPAELALVVAIAAKAATLHALRGRFDLVATRSANTSNDPSPSNSGTSTPTNVPPADVKPTKTAELNAKLVEMRERTAAEAAEWLARVCAHVGVDLGQLPDALDSKTKLSLPVRSDRQGDGAPTEEQLQWDTTWELVLVSLGLVGSAAANGQEDKPEQSKSSGLPGKLSSRVGLLFSSSSAASSTTASPHTASSQNRDPDSPSQPPPLNYTALSRSLISRTLDILSIPQSVLTDVEHTIAQFLYFQLQERNRASDAERETEQAKSQVGWDNAAKEYRERAAKKGNALKWAATGAGFVLGGVAIGLTGGLAAPAIAAGLGTFGFATFSGAGGAVLIGTLLGLGGGGLAGYRTHRRLKGLDDVSFVPIQELDAHEFPQIPSLTATIVASGFLLDEEDSVAPWRTYVRTSRADAYALKADPQTFLEAGRSLDKFIKNRLITMGGVEVIKRTALAAVYAGVALPLTIFQTTTTAFDSDFTRCRDKAQKAGVLLAEILEKEVQGKRPVVLVGYGPGASLIFSCLEHLASLSLDSLVYSAILISLPASPSNAQWVRARSVVSHELVNAWSGNDWVLGIAARLFTLSPSIAGIRPVTLSSSNSSSGSSTGHGAEASVVVTNVDISDLLVRGHLDLRNRLDVILERIVDKRDEQPTGSGAADAERAKRALAAQDKEEEDLVQEMKTLDV